MPFSTMNVVRVDNLDELAALRSDWNRLSDGVPFRRHEWLATWWHHFGPTSSFACRRELYVLCVFDGRTSESLVALAPWYIERSRTLGRVIRFLGSGIVCSDYLSVLCHSGFQQAAADALSE